MFLSDEPGVEIRLPHTRIIQKAAQLTVIPMIITEAAINTTIDNFSFKGKKTSIVDNSIARLYILYDITDSIYQQLSWIICFAHRLKLDHHCRWLQQT